MKNKFRISDILKKVNKAKQDAPQDKSQLHALPRSQEQGAKQQPPLESVASAEAVKAYKAKISTNVGALYSKAVSCAKEICRQEITEADVDSRIPALVEKMNKSISADNDELIKFALADYVYPGDYLAYHVVNVTTMCLYIGHGLGYEYDCLTELGVAAFLHDLGLYKYQSIVNQTRLLSEKEYSDIKQHPIDGVDILGKIGKNLLSRNVFEVLRQEHERIDGSGYPKGLEGEEINEYAQLVGVVDMYEAMTHRRPYRFRHNPLDTIKTILGSKKSFNHKLVKSIIERIGIFPVGTLVQLNTKEVGEVLAKNPDLPLRPKVRITLDAAGRKLTPIREINLASNPTVYILGVPSE